MPWFVKVNEDHGDLEIAKSGTLTEILEAHRDMVPGQATPWGLPVKYGKLTFAFHGATSVTGAGPVSNALVGRVKWNHPEVKQELSFLFRKRESIDDHVRELRQWLEGKQGLFLQQFRDGYDKQKKAEEAYYGVISYYYTKQRGLPRPPPNVTRAADLDARDEREFRDNSTEHSFATCHAGQEIGRGTGRRMGGPGSWGARS